jgi:hypothetical protein
MNRAAAHGSDFKRSWLVANRVPATISRSRRRAEGHFGNRLLASPAKWRQMKE